MENSNLKVVIKLDEKKPYANLDWEPYKGQLVDVIYRQKEDITVSQLVTSFDIINSEDEKLAALVDDFLLRAEMRMGPFHKIAEAGRWTVRGKGMYTSGVFTSYSINSIKSEDALPPLASIINEALTNEAEENIKSLILMHTHPIPNTPLSPGDCNTVKSLAKKTCMEKGDLIQIMAVPINKSDLIFRYDLYA